MRRSSLPVRIGFALLALALIAGLVLPMAWAAPAETSGTPGAVAAESDTSEATADRAGQIVLLGVGGLRWDDVSALATPALWRFAEEGAIGNVVVRSVRTSACPADGWLAVSSGRRAADLPVEEADSGVPRPCREIATEGGSGSTGDGLSSALWQEYLDAAADDPYDATPGALGAHLSAHGVLAAGIGPGATIALADPEGSSVGTVAARPEDPAELAALVAGTQDADLLVIDLGDVRDAGHGLVEGDGGGSGTGLLTDGPTRAQQVEEIAARIDAVLEGLDDRPATAPEPTVLLATLSDSGSQPVMRLLALTGPDVDPGLVWNSSTRQPGMVQATDVTPTLLRLLDVPALPGAAGAPMLPRGDDGDSATARVATLVDELRHSIAIRPIAPVFTGVIVVANLVLYAAVTIGLNRRIRDRRARAAEQRRDVTASSGTGSPRPQEPVPLRGLRAAAASVAALPVASWLANLLPWWRSDAPALVLLATTVCGAALLGSLGLARWWRGHLLAPVIVIAGLTAAVLAVDALTGTRLQLSSLLGIQPQVGGRFYGFNNSSFALWAASTLLIAACLVQPLIRRGRRRLAAAAVLGVGALATVLNGAPTIGADFGGPPALIAAFLVLALLVSGMRLSVWRTAVVVAAGMAVAIGFAVVDWLRPADERTHLGRFVETVLDGGLVTVVLRNLSQNLATIFGSWLSLIAFTGALFVALVILRPLRHAARTGDAHAYGWLAPGATLADLTDRVPVLRPALVSVTLALVVGFAVNDSGIVIPALGMSLALPLLVTVLLSWLLELRRDDETPDAGVSSSQPTAR